MKSVRTKTPDGTEIRNYVNSRDVVACSGGGTIYAGYVNQVTYDEYMSCSHAFPICNNIFYIKDGRVLRYTPIGSGGAACYTNATARPGFHGPANY
jgi:hypothetical protein